MLRRWSTIMVGRQFASSQSNGQRTFAGLKWAPLPVGAGLAYICYQQYHHIRDRDKTREDMENPWPKWRIDLYTALPLNTVSRAFGWVADCEIPRWLRKPLFGLYSRKYNCNIDEAVEPDLSKYRSLMHFFGRSVKPHLRPISESCLVSPADGVVLQYGRVLEGRVRHVKGHDYDVYEFLGPFNTDNKKDTSLYAMVIYLGPGDYHGFHSPTNWTVHLRRYFPGLLISVQHAVLRGVPRLLCINERVVLNGEWKHGFFSYTAVAATNVGNISILADPELRTNLPPDKEMSEKALTEKFVPGEKIGDFRLGSTIVLVFEAPDNFNFTVKAGDHMRYGETIGMTV
uniref:Phosphatidylserine decarboxylase proenzyme, mitochondrial n=1 Tax=Plectus sambesii TaxID=2011161 RepID=A0A914V5G0_9BILA